MRNHDQLLRPSLPVVLEGRGGISFIDLAGSFSGSDV